MGKRGIILAGLLLSSCIPSVGRREPEPEPVPRPSSEPSRATLQCQADLARDGFAFRALPDRIFPGGCSALGAVQLLDVSIPVTNLGAMTCPVARQFARWAREAVQPAASAWLDSHVVRIESMGTYSCRPINGQAGNRLSEHGRANAVDISAFVLANGRRITVLAGWNGPDQNVRRFLRAVHGSACRRFQIVLGPDANALHRDHFHFDMGQGPYCR